MCGLIYGVDYVYDGETVVLLGSYPDKVTVPSVCEYCGEKIPAGMLCGCEQRRQAIYEFCF